MVDAALFKQFNDYLKEKNKIFSDLTPEEQVSEGQAFMADKYPGAKFPPNQLVGMMSSPSADAEKTIKAAAIFNPQPTNNCPEPSTGKRRRKRYATDSGAKYCPDNTWWYNGYGSCVHYNPNGQLKFADALSYCSTLGPGILLFQLEYEGSRSLLSYIGFWSRLPKCKELWISEFYYLQ